MSDYWFFLSYARRNDVSHTLANDNAKNKKLVRRFYEDLAGEIISRANTGRARTVEQIGFFDQLGIEPGDKWDDTVAEALRTARVMLCLFTRNYFTSTVCGQEFEVFRTRVQKYADEKAIKQPPLIIPVLWHRADKLPSTLPPPTADLQHTYDEFSKVYAAEGLEFIMRLTKHADDYQQFLMNLADRLIEVAEKHSLPTLAECPPLNMVSSAFHAKPTALAAQAPEAKAENTLENSGPSFAHFVFVAGQSQELQVIRTRLEAYGKEGRFWKPYIPDVDKPAGLFTQRAATDLDLQHEVLPVTPALLEQLEKADETNTIVVLIVDPWTLNVQVYQDQMRGYDKRNLVSCAVLVVWNCKDREPGCSSQALQQKVRETFRNNLTNNNMYIRSAVTSETDLLNELTAAIVEIRRRLNERAKLFHPVESAGYSAVPQVGTPAGGTQ